MKILCFQVLLSVLLCTQIKAQNVKNRVISIPAERNGLPLQDGWTGGMNSPQFSQCDLNRDGINDLVVFDRVGEKVMTYLNRGDGSDTTFYYAPQYEEIFPADMKSWMLVRDYNHDTLPDLFTYTSAGTKVYKGSLQGDTLIRFDLVSPLLLFRFDQVTYTNIWTSSDDVPAFVDVNFDGDIDILTFDVLGGSTIQYFENQTMENTGNPAFHIDSFKYEIVTKCWGGVAESNLDNSVQLGISCKTEEGITELNDYESRHAGSTIFALDDGNDHDIDLLLGDISFANMVFLENCGDSSFASVCDYDTIFPSCNTSVTLPIFPAGFTVDADNDGFDDLLVSPNARSGARDVNNVMFYKNVNDTACNYAYKTDSFLVDQSFDFGTDSKPVFFDYNGDGLLDIAVGNYGYFRPFSTYKSTVAILENIGTQAHPAYKLRTNDYQNISTYSRIGVYPAFGDMDGDGREDMIIGDSEGYLHYFRNTGGAIASFPTMTTPQYFGIDVGQYATPFIYDVNADGLKDLIVGKRDGKITYFWNFGTTSSPQFHSDSSNTNFGGINVMQNSASENYAAPVLARNGNNELMIYTGSARGTIYQHTVDAAKLRSGSFTLLTEDYLQEDVGSKSTISIADINNDGHWEYVVGNARGGVMLYSDSLWNPGTTFNLSTGIVQVYSKGSIILYPNPAKNYVNISIAEGNFENADVQILNTIGERFATEMELNSNIIRLNTSGLAKGMYFVRIIGLGNTYTARMIIE